MTNHYEALRRVKRVLEHASSNYQRLAPTRCTARGCAMYLDISRILNGFAEKVAEDMEEEKEKENEER